jgi:exoribonuclease R
MIDLTTVARAALHANGFTPDLDDASRAQLTTLAPSSPTDGVRDLRALLWSSIDNTESRDLDQVEYAESLPDGAIRLSIGIADVDVLVPARSIFTRARTPPPSTPASPSFRCCPSGSRRT